MYESSVTHSEPKPGKIYAAIPAMIAEVQAVHKDRENKQQGYRFRGVDDVYNVCNIVLGKHGVFTTTEVLKEEREERNTKSGGVMIYVRMVVRFTFTASDGSSVQSLVNQEGSDTSDKASGKALSMAFKYAMFQLLCIPTEDTAIDNDEEKHDFAAKDGDDKAKSKPKGEGKGRAKKQQTPEEAFEDEERPANAAEQQVIDDLMPQITRAKNRNELVEISVKIKEQPGNVRKAVREIYKARLHVLPDAKEQKWIDDCLTNVLPNVPNRDALDVIAADVEKQGNRVKAYLQPHLDARYRELPANAG